MRSFLVASAAVIFTAAPAFAATYTAVENVPAVVWVTDVAPTPTSDVAIHQTMKTFVPALAIVPVGSSIAFPNDDPFYHSVYSDSPGNAFDIGLYDTGPGKSVRFVSPGIVDVHCHVHGTMHAVIVVVDGPYAQTTTPNARVRIDGIAPGRHVVHTWTGGDDVATATVDFR
jgi:plastocyanin